AGVCGCTAVMPDIVPACAGALPLFTAWRNAARIFSSCSGVIAFAVGVAGFPNPWPGAGVVGVTVTGITGAGVTGAATGGGVTGMAGGVTAVTPPPTEVPPLLWALMLEIVLCNWSRNCCSCSGVKRLPDRFGPGIVGPEVD